MSEYRRSDRNGKKRKALDTKLIILCAVAAILVIAVVIAIFALRGDGAKDAQAAATIAPTTESTSALAAESTSAPTAEPTPEAHAYAVVSPTAMAEGYLPIYNSADTTEKIIAITVDDFYQFTNARTIIDLALENGGKLTIFPIGINVLREELQDTIRYAHENGMEIENHTYQHVQFCGLNDTKMEKQMFLQSMAVSHVLGVEYQEHFFRPKGGDGRYDQRTHMYAAMLGIKGIAHWNVTGSGTNIKKLVDGLAPGNIYLFHTTDADLQKLQTFIPEAVKAGYKLVTLNEMFGLPDNETSPLTTPIKEHVMPELGSYELSPRSYKKGDYMWKVCLIQQRLIELGYMSGDADGVFGEGTYKAIGRFQKKNGMKATGEADPDTQTVLFSDSAKKNKK